MWKASSHKTLYKVYEVDEESEVAKETPRAIA